MVSSTNREFAKTVVSAYLQSQFSKKGKANYLIRLSLFP